MDAETPEAQPAEGQPPALRDYLEFLLRRRWVIAVWVVLCLVAAAAYVAATPRVYEATSTVVIEAAGGELGSLQLVPSLLGLQGGTFTNTLAQIIQSRSVADLAVARLGDPPARRGETRRWIQTTLRVQVVPDTDLVRISVDGPTPGTAADNANAVARAFVDWDLGVRRATATAAREFIEAQLARVGGQLRAGEARLAAYQSSHNQISLDAQTKATIDKLAALQAQREAALAQIRADDASLERARAILERQAPTVQGGTVSAEDPVTAQLRQQLAALEVQLVGLRQQFTDRAPQVLAVQAQIEDVKRQLETDDARYVASQTTSPNPLRAGVQSEIIKLEVDREARQAEAQALAAAVAQYDARLRTIPPQAVELADLVRDVKVGDAAYQLLSEKFYEARIAEVSVVGDAMIVDTALPPAQDHPVRPKPLRAGMVALLLGALAGVGTAYGLEALDTSLKTPEEAERLLGLPVLAVVPHELRPGEGAGRRGWARQFSARLGLPRGPAGGPPSAPLVLRDWRSPVADAFRYLRTNIAYTSPDRPLRRILVTSPGPGEGKSTVCANLAGALAQAGRRVRVVECDLRRPVMAWAYQLPTAFGLTELLCGEVPPEQAVHPSGTEGVWVIPAGAKPPNPTELLGSQRMQSVLAAEDGVDAVLLDAPPVLAVPDATILAPHVDGVVFVVRAGVTPREAARRAIQLLAASGARVLGVVVNAVPRRGRGYSPYSYSYGYGYGYGDEAGEGSGAARGS
jgi:succinoglycan biosynthesis transport protein ExoP